ncbi:unnamed protein product [Polarella glacialis]|uniref:Uncharacterized protein n=1 Tax=Polarella glacialis TaxID=89957 RepID=A0A813LLX5_POLGL|nr:unnamed protein product [Polarella glacialis]
MQRQVSLPQPGRPIMPVCPRGRGLDGVSQPFLQRRHSWQVAVGLFLSLVTPISGAHLAVNSVAPTLKGDAASEDLRNWLRTLQLQIPKASFLKAGLNITLENLTCTDIQIQSVITTKQPGSPLTMSVKAVGLGATCHMAWRYVAVNVPILGASGTVKVVVGEDSSLSGPLTLQLDSDPVAPLPKKLATGDCKGKLVVTDLKFSGPGLVGWVLQALSGVIKSSLSLIPPLLCSQLDEAIAKLDMAKWRNASLARPKDLIPLAAPGVDIIDWRGNRFFTAVADTVSQVLGNVSGQSGINTIMANILGSAEGNLSVWTAGSPGEPKPLSVVVPQLGACELAIPELSIAGLTSFRRLLLGSDQEQLNMKFAAALDRLSWAGTCSLRCIPVPPYATGPPLTELFSFSGTLSNISIDLLGDLAVHQGELNDRILSAPRQCLPGALAAGQLQSLGLKITPKCLVTQPQSGDSLEQDVDLLINTLLEMSLDALAPSIRTLLFGFVRGAGRDALNNLTVAWPQATPCLPGPPPDAYAYYSASDAAGILAILLTLPALVLSCKGHPLFETAKKASRDWRTPDLAVELQDSVESPSHRHHGGILSGGRDSSSSSPVMRNAASANSMAVNHEMASEPMASRCLLFCQPSWECLAAHQAVGARAAVAVPLILVAIALMFLCSNLSIGAKVNILLDLSDQTFLLPGVFDFSLVSSIIDMWNSGAFALAVLIGFFSGCWPYLKLGLMLLCWYSTPETLCLQRRKALLEFLDAYGKWSLVDTYVLVMFMVSFQIEVSSTSPAVQAMIGPVGPIFSFKVVVQPGASFHCFLGATILSLVAGHVVTAYNRRAAEHDRGDASHMPVEEPKTRMCTVSNTSKTWSVLVPVALFASLVVVMAGTAVDSFQFNFAGLANVALGEDGSRRPFSLIKLGEQLPAASGDPNSVGIRWIQFVFFLFSLVVIVLYHGLLLFLWLAPLTRSRQKKLVAAAQTLQAWSAIDVFVVSIIASVMEISMLVKFMVGDKCDAIDKFLQSPPAVIAGWLPPELVAHPTCVDLTTSLEPGCWCLFAGALVSAVVGQVVTNRMAKALSESSEAVDSLMASAEDAANPTLTP